MSGYRHLPRVLVIWGLLAGTALQAQEPVAADRESIAAKLTELRTAVETLQQKPDAPMHLTDVEVLVKAVDWALRHKEFYTAAYSKFALQALDLGLTRIVSLGRSEAPWNDQPGRTIRGYHSAIDDSLQPYAVTLPATYTANDERRWPLYLVLHGRGDKMNEISFIHSHEGKPAAASQDWIQLDVYGRGNNAYRFSGETDVFEALADVKRRYRIDDRRIVLHGFSMGGAGAWHLGLHHPSRWCSVGPGAGFVDFYKYQNRKSKLPFYQDNALHIYDAIDYAMNAADVPVCTYGGELDKQLVASTSMVDAAKKLEIPIKLIVGPGMGHKFHPDSLKEFMAFHHARQEQGRPTYPGNPNLRFITWTLKYNRCDWLTIEEIEQQYRPATVEANRDEKTGLLKIKTSNITVMQLARDIAEQVEIDGTRLPLASAADGLLSGVYYETTEEGWRVRSATSSLTFEKNLDGRKRHNLQGPIDDAFMGPFVCVRGTGKPWSEPQTAWANWTLDRFSREFDKWLRGKTPVVDDSKLSLKMIANKNLILFGDPGSNSVLGKMLHDLPIQWTRDELIVNGQKYDPQTHGVSLIFPNPLNPRRYVVVNSGHTFHEFDFKSSNSWLFPRLADIAVQKFTPNKSGGYDEEVLFADFFNSAWRLPSGLEPRE